MLNVAIVQSPIVWEDIDANLTAFSRMFDRIEGPVDVLLLPELFTTGFTMRSRELAETMDGRTVDWMAETAAKFRCDLAGSLIIREGERYFNRLVWMHDNGTCRFYDKRHLFRMSGEDDHYSRGKDHVIVESRGFRFRPLICYDLRFPVWSRNKADYDVLIYLANWPAPRREVWLALLKARAIENQAYVIGVNRVGRDGMDIDYAGDSMILDPRGRCILQFESNSAGIQQCRLSLEDLHAFREKFPAWKDADGFTLDI